MKISNYAVKNYQFTLIIFLMIVVVGITTVLTMPRAEDPEMNAPQFPLIVVYPGTSPEDLEEMVVKPIEKKLFELEDIERINTTVSDGVVIMGIYCNYSVDADEKYSELVREINSLSDELPKDIVKIDLQKVTPTGTNILQMALVSNNASQDKLKIYSEQLQEDLEKVTGLM